MVDFGLRAAARLGGFPAFVLDIAAVGQRLAVIELNGFNSSGFYASDVEAIVAHVSRVAEASA